MYKQVDFPVVIHIQVTVAVCSVKSAGIQRFLCVFLSFFFCNFETTIFCL